MGREVPYAAMGGLTGFSSLIEGYLRLDPSGSGISVYSDTSSTDMYSVYSKAYRKLYAVLWDL